MTTKHTPGPWRIGKFHGAVVADVPVNAGLDNDHVEAYGGHLIAESIAVCDRPLIAAAPERLEALEIMIVGACAVGVPHAGERKVLQDAVDHARATINKARGAQ